MASLAWVHVVGGGLAGPVGRDEAGQALDLVVLEQAHVDGEQDQQDSTHDEQEQVAAGHAGDGQHDHQDHDHHDGGAQVGLFEDEEDGHGGHHHQTDQITEVEALGPPGTVGGDGDDQHQRGELRGLELEGSEGEPALGPLPLRGGQDRHQGQQDADVQEGADLLEFSVVHQGQGGHHHHPDDHEGGLALEEVTRIVTGPAQPATGGRVDHQHAERRQQQGGTHQDGVEPGRQVPRSNGDSCRGVTHQDAPAQQATRPSAATFAARRLLVTPPDRVRPPSATWPPPGGRGPSSRPAGGQPGARACPGRWTPWHPGHGRLPATEWSSGGR